MAENTVPFHAQIEVLAKTCPIKGTEVDIADNLVTLPVEYNYVKKPVWVKGENAFYFLATGDGSVIGNWQKLQFASTSIQVYSQLKTYQATEAVYLGTTMYIALESIALGETPISHPAKWLRLGGAADNLKYTFEATEVVIVNTDKLNPVFMVFIGDEQVIAYIKKTDVTEYTIKFNRPLTGYVNIA